MGRKREGGQLSEVPVAGEAQRAFQGRPRGEDGEGAGLLTTKGLVCHQ